MASVMRLNINLNLGLGKGWQWGEKRRCRQPWFCCLRTKLRSRPSSGAWTLSGPKVLILLFLGRLCVGVRAQELRFRDSDKRS